MRDDREVAIEELYATMEDFAHQVLRDGYLTKKDLSDEMIRFAKRLLRRKMK